MKNRNFIWYIIRYFANRIITRIQIYFKWLKNGNIFVKEVEDTDGDNELVFPKPFKRMITYGKGYNNVMIILTTF